MTYIFPYCLWRIVFKLFKSKKLKAGFQNTKRPQIDTDATPLGRYTFLLATVEIVSATVFLEIPHQNRQLSTILLTRHLALRRVLQLPLEINDVRGSNKPAFGLRFLQSTCVSLKHSR